MNTKPTYEELLTEIAKLKQQLEEKTTGHPLSTFQDSFVQQNTKLQNEKDEYEAINEELRQTNLELSLAKEKAEKSEKIYLKLVENSPWGMHFYKLKNNALIFIGANPAANKLLGVDNSQFIGKTIEEAFPPLINTEVPFRYREAAEKGILWKTEQINYQDNEISGAFEVIAYQISAGKMVAVFNDITERKRYEKQLKEKNEEFEAQNEEYQQLNEELTQTNEELINTKNRIEKSEERFRLMLKNSNDTFVLVNKNGEQFFISDAAARDTGFTIEELMGPIQNVIYPPDLDIVLQAWNKVLNTRNETVKLQYRHKHKHKEYVWFEAVAQNHLDNPSINAVVINVRDITNIKETEAILINAKEQAEANELKIKQQAEEIENFFNCGEYKIFCVNTII